MPDARILLATFNGEAHLDEQLDSIGGQTFGDWSILARDDGSRDATVELLNAYRARWPERVRLLAGGAGGGARDNFAALLQEAGDAEYLFLCDQDDVWREDKLEVLVAELRRLEARHGPSAPLLAHSDLALIAADGAPLHPSMAEAQNLQPARRRELRHLLVQNSVTGCAVAINRALRDRALPIPAQAIMHDWWLALVAAAFGTVAFVPEPLVRYRQHGTNAVGAKPYSWGAISRQARQLPEARASLARTFAQAAAFRERYAGELDPGAHALVSAYADLPAMGPLARRQSVVRHGFWKAGAARNLGLLALL